MVLPINLEQPSLTEQPLATMKLRKQEKLCGGIMIILKFQKLFTSLGIAKKKGEIAEKEWNLLLEKYKRDYPQDWEELDRRVNHRLPDNWLKTIDISLREISGDKKSEATRKSSQTVLNMISSSLPELIGGSADLTGSNNTFSTSSKALNLNDYSGNYLFYGVREFGMSAIMNGIALYGGNIPYGGTFWSFQTTPETQ